MMMCVKDEADTIADHLHYHHALGVTRAYVFLDGCSDETEAILDGFEWVVAIDRPHPEDCRYLTAHQMVCAAEALEHARSDGFDWLMYIDPDEFAWADNPADTLHERGELIAMLKKTSPETEQVWLLTKEVVAIRGTPPQPPWAQCHFQEQPHVLKRDILDPVSGRTVHLDKWVGHDIGKSIVRTDCDAVPLDTHRWGRRHGEGPKKPGNLVTEALGFHYHFVLPGPRLWWQKYRKHAWTSDHWSTGDEVPFPKQAWKEACASLSLREAERYYEEQVTVDEATVRRALADGRIVHETVVRDTMERLRVELAG